MWMFWCKKCFLQVLVVNDMNSSRQFSDGQSWTHYWYFPSRNGNIYDTQNTDVCCSVCFKARKWRWGLIFFFFYLCAGSSYIRVPAVSPQVNWRISSHKDVCPIIWKAVVNDSSCEASMHHFQADLSLTSRSRVLLIQIYIWQDTLWAYIKWIRTLLWTLREPCLMQEKTLSKDRESFVVWSVFCRCEAHVYLRPHFVFRCFLFKETFKSSKISSNLLTIFSKRFIAL